MNIASHQYMRPGFGVSNYVASKAALVGLTKSAAVELAALGIDVEVMEQADEPGGHARQFTCKATDKCVKCGACIVEEKIMDAVSNPKE